MLRPAVNQIITKNESCYSLVIAVARRAREIADEYNERGEICDDKTVLLAVDEFKDHKYEILEPDFEE